MISVTSSYDRPISGSDLEALSENLNYLDRVFTERVPVGADIALERIRQRYGDTPTIDGNLADIHIIRDFLYSSVKSIEELNGLVITAPHTHWEERRPVIYTYLPDKKAYVIGPQRLLANAMYIPVSFIFNEESPLPYEWVDSTVQIDTTEWNQNMRLIKELNQFISKSEIDLFGIAIDFRFRSSLKGEPQYSLERPLEENLKILYPDCSLITHELVPLEQMSIELMEQVSWHPHSDRFFNFDVKEKEILQELRNELSALQDDNAREAFIKSLEHSQNESA